MQKKQVSWTDLPHEILSLITEKLIESEKISIKRTCKALYDVVHNQSNKHEILPWVMFHRNCTINLFDPAGQKTYALKSPPRLLKPGWVNKDYTRSKGWELNDCTRFHYSKLGWLLFSNYKTKSIFFYNPFSNEVVQLPYLEEQNAVVLQATFSSAPKSPDCVTVVCSHVKYKRYNLKTKPAEIRICQMENRLWKTFRLQDVKGILREIVCCGDWVYCWSYSGQVYGLDLKREEWKVVTELPRDGGVRFPYLYDNILAGVSGDLMLYKRGLELRRFDAVKEEWISVADGEKEIVFDNVVHLLSIPATGNAKGLGETEWQRRSYGECRFVADRIWIQPPFQTN